MHLSLATEYHLGLLKAKLAKYRAQLLDPVKSGAAAKVGKHFSCSQHYTSQDPLTPSSVVCELTPLTLFCIPVYRGKGLM